MYRTFITICLLNLLFIMETTQVTFAADVVSITDNLIDGELEKYSTYEANFTLDQTFANPYDPDRIEVNALITLPNGQQISHPAFWYEGYFRTLQNGVEQLESNGVKNWKIKYTPRLEGAYSYKLEVKDKVSNTTSIYPSNNNLTFIVTPSANPGFLKVSHTDSSYLEYENGDLFLGIGHNMNGWEWFGEYPNGHANNGGTYDYDQWLQSLSDNGGNMTHFDFGEGDQIEWTQDGWDGLVRYNQERAWKMDYIFDKASSVDISYFVALWHWEDFDADDAGGWPHWGWNRNPYNLNNGGPSGGLIGFFNNSQAISLQKKLLRYIIARWGYSPNLIGWELWNEVDTMFYSHGLNPFDHEETIDQWNEEMSSYIKEVDVHDHLVTTTYGSIHMGRNTWSLDNIDIAPLHHYSFYNPEAGLNHGKFETEKTLLEITRNRLVLANKPTLFTEFSLEPGGFEQRNNDSEGIAFHNQLWTSLMSKSLGTAMHWNWGSYIHPKNLDTHYLPIRNFFSGVDLRGMEHFYNFDSTRQYYFTGLKSSDKALVWIVNKYYNYLNKELYSSNPVTNQSINIPELNDGRYKIKTIDTYSGETIDEIEKNVAGDLVVNLPDFQKDIALKIERITLPGDANGDDFVTGVDYVIWLNNFGRNTNAGASEGDFDNNGTVNGVDYVIWLNNYTG